MKKLSLLSLLFITQPSFAELMCDMSISKYLTAYELNSYTCSSDQYLPANTLGCVSCPNGFSCTGGTFNFNENIFQGLFFDIKDIPSTTMNNICATNFPNKLHVVYEPNIHNCSAGYYLPANIDECRPCIQNNKCTGGTYAFNKINNQGIEQCANNTFAPTGSAVCYPHILHIGNDNIYLKTARETTPSLNIRVGNDIFYANMTTAPTYMSVNSEHYFKTVYNNEIYYVCDDTVFGE